ncbi:MAG: hypothetical protein DRH12_09770 [Deltaproteobacteria bacterium]|nr:MAG: hypothetical protein DRH12_09770 [Deltaproteobacteria bacterium]
MEEEKFSIVKHSSISDTVFETLHKWIVTGKLKPGDRLPSQGKLAEQFGISRNTLREAINKLTVMGLLTTKQGVGTTINISSPMNYLSAISDHILLDKATVREFIEARLLVEQAAASLAIKRADREKIAELIFIVDKQAEALEKRDLSRFIELDSSFHRELARQSGNRVIFKFLEAVGELLQKFIGEVALLPGAIESAVKFHRAIVECMERRDEKGARDKIREHLYDVTKRIEKSLNVALETDALFENC